MTEKEKRALFRRWRELVNMRVSELQRFLDEYGNEAGLSREAASKQGIKSGRDSARALIRMLEKLGGEKKVGLALERWNEGDWRWAKRQVSFIQRMRGTAADVMSRGNEPYYDSKRRPKRLLLALNLWGHKPNGRLAK
jgi:hypothetical protein